MYARLVNNDLRQAPNYFVINNMKVWNASEEEYNERGWYLVVLTDEPTTDESHYAKPYWEMINNEIVQQWEIKEVEPTAEELLEIILGGAE